MAGVCTRASFRGIVAEHGWNKAEMMRTEEAKNVRVEMEEEYMVLYC